MTTPDIEAAYLQFRRMLFGALATLAREGLTVPPFEAADLVHDFFADVWPAVARGYDAHRGRLEPYVYRSFVNFAKPRIIALQQWRSHLAEGPRLAELAADADADQWWQSVHNASAVVDALRHLPPLYRQVLYAYMTEPTGERALSAAFGLSRYRFRIILVEAIGRAAILLGERGKIPQSDWLIAKKLWADGLSADEVAAETGRTIEQIRQSRRRITKALLEGLKQSQEHNRRPEKRTTMGLDIKLLLEQVLRSPGKMELLTQVKQHAQEILDYLEAEKTRFEWEKIDKEWLGQVYGAIAGDEVLSTDEMRTMELIMASTRGQESRIGYVFKEVLMRDLPKDDIATLERRLSACRKASAEEQKDLIDTPSVQAAMPDAVILITYGISPLTVFYVTEAVGGYIARLWHYKAIKEGRALILDADEPDSQRNDVTYSSPHGEALRHSRLCPEIARVANCNLSIARALLPWLTGVALTRPFIFKGLEAKPVHGGGGILLVPVSSSSDRDEEIELRWAVPAYA